MKKIQEKEKNEKSRKLKKNEKIKSAKSPKGFWLHTENPRRIPGFPLLLLLFSMKYSTISMFWGMCLFPEENQQPILGSPFSRRKAANFIGLEAKTHILRTKINEIKFAKVSSSNNNFSLRIISHSTTTTPRHGRPS